MLYFPNFFILLAIVRMKFKSRQFRCTTRRRLRRVGLHGERGRRGHERGGEEERQRSEGK